MEQRKTSLVTMGDSEISGEGVGNYVPGTHQPGNWCDRSYDQAVFRTGIASDVQYNLACSGAEPAHLIYGSGKQQWNELNQGDYLAIKARNTKIKLIWVVVGANGEGTIQFGPVATDCALRRVFFLGPCYPTYTDQWAVRVDGSRQQVEQALASIKQTMTDAGYLPSDYELVFMSYPSPGSPDVEDNPNFPGWYSGGCLLYLHDMAFARNKAVPLFERALRQAALNQGVRYLDASRLFHGHEPCTDNTMVRGLYIELGIWDENAARQSFHPNYRGHGAFAECITAFYASGLPTAPASTRRRPGTPRSRRAAGVQAAAQRRHRQLRGRQGVQLAQQHGAAVVPLPRRAQPGLLVRPDAPVAALGAVPRPLPGRLRRQLRRGHQVNIYDCNGTNAEVGVPGNQIKPEAAQHLCLAFDNPLLGTPRLRLASCGSSEPSAVGVRVAVVRQPGRLRARRLHRFPGLLIAAGERAVGGAPRGREGPTPATTCAESRSAGRSPCRRPWCRPPRPRCRP